MNTVSPSSPSTESLLLDDCVGVLQLRRDAQPPSAEGYGASILHVDDDIEAVKALLDVLTTHSTSTATFSASSKLEAKFRALLMERYALHTALTYARGFVKTANVDTVYLDKVLPGEHDDQQSTP